MTLIETASAISQASFELAVQLSLFEAYVDAKQVTGQPVSLEKLKAHADCLRGRVDHLDKLIKG